MLHKAIEKHCRPRIGTSYGDSAAAFAKMAATAMITGSSMNPFELSFPHSYEIRECPELPGSGPFEEPVFYFPNLGSRPEHDGVWIEVCPSGGPPWLGVFAFGGLTTPGFSKVLSTPDPSRVCVISGGAGYLVNAGAPDEWTKIPVLPVTYACSVPEHGFLLLANFSNLAAWNATGEIWRTQFSFDGVRITKIGSEVIDGYGYDPACGADVPFAVNTRTGSHRSLAPTQDSSHSK